MLLPTLHGFFHVSPTVLGRATRPSTCLTDHDAETLLPQFCLPLALSHHAPWRIWTSPLIPWRVDGGGQRFLELGSVYFLACLWRALRQVSCWSGACGERDTGWLISRKEVSFQHERFFPTIYLAVCNFNRPSTPHPPACSSAVAGC